MADKTTTLKTKTNDNVYPNVIGDNRDNAIVDSAHIKHTLTADHKINFRIDDNVSNLIFNSLQKPKGLTKTELVGVGTNGQENIEIGDNLTLANGKLSATGGGKSVSPTLWLIDVDNLKARTTITEEEYNNLKNQLYNQVIYFPDTDYNDAYYLSKLVYVFGTFYFAQCHGVYDEALNSDRIVSLIEYEITIGEKDTNGNYPITIKNTGVKPFGSIPQLPADASTSTYVLKAVNGTVQWVKES